MQLELFRQAGQDLLARLAPDLAAQLLMIFRAHSRQSAPAPAADVDTIASCYEQPANTSTFQDQAATEGQPSARSAQTSVITAAGMAGPALHDDRSGLLTPEIPSQAELSQVSYIQSQLATAIFSDASTLPLLDGNDRAQPSRSAASFSSAHIPIERPSRPSQLPADVAIEGSPAGGVAPAASQESTRSVASVRAQASQVQQQIEQDAKHSHLVVLQSQESVQYSSHVLVMQGSIKLEGCPVTTQLVSGQHYSCANPSSAVSSSPIQLIVSPISLCCAVLELISFDNSCQGCLMLRCKGSIVHAHSGPCTCRTNVYRRVCQPCRTSMGACQQAPC